MSRAADPRDIRSRMVMVTRGGRKLTPVGEAYLEAAR